MTTVKRYLLISILNLKQKQMQPTTATPHLSTFNSELFVLKGLVCRMQFFEVSFECLNHRRRENIAQ